MRRCPLCGVSVSEGCAVYSNFTEYLMLPWECWGAATGEGVGGVATPALFFGKSYMCPFSGRFLPSFSKARQIYCTPNIFKIASTVPWYYHLTPPLQNSASLGRFWNKNFQIAFGTEYALTVENGLELFFNCEIQMVKLILYFVCSVVLMQTLC